MIVVSNTSPITNLAGISFLDILRQLYDTIYIPSAVFYEISNYKQPGVNEIKSSDWIVHKNITNKALAMSLENDLDKGESEAITLALDLKADLLIIDERAGRFAASQLGLNISGILGILLDAKNHNVIPQIKPFLDNLIVKSGFWIRNDLYNRILKAAKE